MNNPLDEKLLRVNGVADRLDVSKSTVWLLVRQGKLAKPLKVTAHTSAWRESDVIEFIDSLGN